MANKENTDEEAPVSVVRVCFKDAVIPEPTEKVASGGWVKYGDDNLYDQDLNTLYYESPIHQGIINTKVDFITAGGVTVTGSLEAQDEEIQANGSCKFTLNEVVNAVSPDLEIGEHFFLLFKKDAVTKTWCVDTISRELMKPNEDGTFFYYSENWGKVSQKEGKFGFRTYKSIFFVQLEDIPATENAPARPADTECILWVKTPPKQHKIGEGKKAKLSTNLFPVVRYSGAIPLIQADIEMNWFHFSESVNGFTSGHILNMNNGVPDSEDKKRKIVGEIHDQASDRKKKGGITVFFNNGKDRAASIETISGSGNDARYLPTQEYIRSETMIGHSVQNAALFGLETPGKLGASTDLEKAYLRLMGTWGKPRREQISQPIEFGLSLLNKWAGFELSWDESIPNWIKETPPVEDEASLLDTLNSMSPLLATKFLEQLTADEIRGLGNLGALAPGQTPIGTQAPEPTLQSMQEKQDSIIEHFQSIGVPKEECNIIHSHGFDYEMTDEDYMGAFLVEKFQGELSESDSRILQMINKGENQNSIRTALDVSATELAQSITRLTNEGFIEEWSLTTQGSESVATEELISVLYTYELRDDVSGPEKLPDGRTRDFCAALLDLNRAYTRFEIDAISAAVDRDVWIYRGGWWNDDGVNKPSCRHFWKQNIVLK